MHLSASVLSFLATNIVLYKPTQGSVSSTRMVLGSFTFLVASLKLWNLLTSSVHSSVLTITFIGK